MSTSQRSRTDAAGRGGPRPDRRDGRDWRVVVPVKAPHLAKTRLHPPVGVLRADLAHAFALDTLDAAAQCVEPGHLVIVTSDPPTRDHALACDAVVVPDPAETGHDDVAERGAGATEPADPLNRAVRAGLRAALRRLGDGPTAVLLGDLPALDPRDLASALDRCGAYPLAFVPDADGTGTVLLSAQRTSTLRPRFGGGSAAAHGSVGHVRLELDLPGLRTDVDDDVALRAVGELGLGEHTAAVLCAAVAACPHGRWRSARPGLPG